LSQLGLASWVSSQKGPTGSQDLKINYFSFFLNLFSSSIISFLSNLLLASSLGLAQFSLVRFFYEIYQKFFFYYKNFICLVGNFRKNASSRQYASDGSGFKRGRDQKPKKRMHEKLGLPINLGLSTSFGFENAVADFTTTMFAHDLLH
jgi:hypothetical protein